MLLAGTAAWFSVSGLVALFSGNVIASIVMGTTIELGKLVGISWLYRNWKTGPWFKWPLVGTVIIALLVTSIGIFGFLSKSHLENNAPLLDTTNKIQLIDAKIVREQEKHQRYLNDIASNKVVLDQLDTQVAALIANNKISDPTKGARAVRESQRVERDSLAHGIEQANLKIDQVQEAIGVLNEEKLQLTLTVQHVEREVGPIKYVAAVFYADPESNVDNAVRIMILLIMAAFDPLAVFLLMAANHSIIVRESGKVQPPSSAPPVPPVSAPPAPSDPPPGDRMLDVNKLRDIDIGNLLEVQLEPVSKLIDNDQTELDRFLQQTSAIKKATELLHQQNVEQYNQMAATAEEVIEAVEDQPEITPEEAEPIQPEVVQQVPTPVVKNEPTYKHISNMTSLLVPPEPMSYNSVFGGTTTTDGHTFQRDVDNLYR